MIAVLPVVPTLKNFSDSLYKCEYATFFKALGAFIPPRPLHPSLTSTFSAVVEEHHLIPSRLLSVHARYYVREMRIKAYAQLLESYRSVTMKNLCDAFGVGEEFMDACVPPLSPSFVTDVNCSTVICRGSSRQGG